MDAKEIKTLLKNAREAVRQKEFKEALKHCKTVISEDANNYMALVLIAVSAEGLEQYDQALKAYKRAIEADQSQILAWQGLCSFYEKNPRDEYVTDQAECYLKMVEFHESDRDKTFEVLQKLGRIIDKITEQANVDKVVKIYEAFIRDERDALKKTEMQISLINILASKKSDNKDNIMLEQLAKETLEQLSEYSDSVERVITLYLQLLMTSNPGEVKKVCSSLHERFPQSATALEYVIIVLLDSHIGCVKAQASKELEEKVELYRKLTSDADSVTLTAAEGYMALCNKEYPKARTTLQKASENTKLVCVPYFQAVISHYLHKHDETVKLCLKGLKLLERKDRHLTRPCSEAVEAFQIVRVTSLYHLGDKQSLAVAMETIEKDLASTDEVSILKGLVLLKQEDVINAKACLVGDSVARMVLEGLIALQGNRILSAIQSFQTAMDREPDVVSHQVLLAKCLWKSEDRKQDCFTVLLKAAKQDPCNSETFLYLGHYYHHVGGDDTRARKCYQKAYDLDPRNEEAGEALCDLLNQQGDELCDKFRSKLDGTSMPFDLDLHFLEQAHTMLLNVTQRASAGCAKWAWLRLGLYQVKHEDPSVAIASFQSALRADPKDNHVWECLGEAYLARGSYTASLKAFTRASELNQDSMYCLFQIASIKQTLGTYTEAIEEYKLILDKSPNYVPALKGIGETYVQVARSLLSKFFDGRARDTCQLAVGQLFRAVSFRPDLSCLWKLIGDACTLLHVLPSDDFRFEKPDKTVMNKLETMTLGGRCYIRALKLLPECSSLWHDLGVNYIHQSHCSTGEAAISLAEKSVQALKKAIQLEPTNHKHWNALGYVACLKVYDKADLAQHCFIKSIQAEHNNVIAWTNLAALYLSRDNVKLAHEAFKIAQSLEPSYVSCWIGQAVIAELVGHEDAMDLFRHTTELGNHVEGALGYGHWVCTMLQHHERKDSYIYTYAIEQMGAVPAASDALARYTERVKTNPVAYNMHGLLLERQKLYRTAAEQFKWAMLLLEKEEGKEKLLHDVTCNLARALMKAGNINESLVMYQRVADDCSFVDVCHFALALYKSQNLALQSSQAYTKAAEMASTDADKSHVLTAIAMALYKLGDVEQAKINLFHSSQMTQPSVPGIKALGALGLLRSDVTLAEAALNELSALEDSTDNLYDMTVLRVGLELMKGNLIGIKRHLQKLLHKDPSQPKLWLLLSSILVKFFPELGRSGAHAARMCIAIELHKSQMSHLLLAAGELSSGCHGNRHPSHNAFLTTQMAVHLYPEKAENWVNLIAGVHAEAILTSEWERRLALLNNEYRLLIHVLSQDITVPMKLWCLKQKVVCTVHANMHNELMECLDQLMTQFGSEADVKQLFDVFSNVLQDKTSGVVSVLNKQSLLYYWQIAIEMYIRAGLMKEVQSVIQQCQSNTELRGKNVLLMKMSHACFQLMMKGGRDLDHVAAIFKQSTGQLLLDDPECSTVHLMQGILGLNDNSRLAKHQLQKVLDSQPNGSRGEDLSIARRAIIFILKSSKKDSELIQTILEDATLAEDVETLQYYNTLD